MDFGPSRQQQQTHPPCFQRLRHLSPQYSTIKKGPINNRIFYAGSKDGQVKPCSIRSDKIEVVGGILAHTQSVNSICSLDDNPFALVTASQDKTVKLWNPSKESYEKMVRSDDFE